MATSDIQINNNGTWQSLFPISIEQGGTGGNDRIEAVDNLLFLGRDPIGSKSEDVLSFWSSKGTGFYWISKNNILNGQPSQYGFLVTLCMGSDVRQWFCSQATGPIYTRSANSSSTSMPSFHNMEPYPVGAVYISYVSTSPASLFGGSWSEIKGRFPYFNHGTGTGGENTHKLTVKEMPSHNHTGHGTSGVDFTLGISSSAAGSVSRSTSFVEGGSGNKWIRFTHSTQSTGGNSAHENMPSYQTFYAWRRTA